jgi:hypothetical protein
MTSGSTTVVSGVSYNPANQLLGMTFNGAAETRGYNTHQLTISASDQYFGSRRLAARTFRGERIRATRTHRTSGATRRTGGIQSAAWNPNWYALNDLVYRYDPTGLDDERTWRMSHAWQFVHVLRGAGEDCIRHTGADSRRNVERNILHFRGRR